MFGIAGTVELGTIFPGTGTWNRLQDGTLGREPAQQPHTSDAETVNVLDAARDSLSASPSECTGCTFRQRR